MCLGIPVRVIELKEEGMATGEVDGVKKEVSIQLLPDTRVGDYVILHAGFAIQKIDEEVARETLELLKEMAEVTPKVSSRA